MSTDRPTRKSKSVEEATISNMWEMVAIVEVFDRKGLWTKLDLLLNADRAVYRRLTEGQGTLPPHVPPNHPMTQTLRYASALMPTRTHQARAFSC